MRDNPGKGRLWVAMAIWAVGLLSMVSLSWWQLQALAKNAENMLIGDAGRTASQLAALLSLPGVRLDSASARVLVDAAMEDDSIYAIHIQTKRGIVEGLRRNYLWEPVPWDDEIAENCAQGMSPIRLAGETVGKVDVWLSPRMNEEEEGLAAQRENLRLAISGALWTGALLLLLAYWGEFRNLGQWLASGNGSSEAQVASEGRIGLGLAKKAEDTAQEKAEEESAPEAEETLVSGSLGREFQCGNAEAWLVTAGMFRQTFGRAPMLISRLYAQGELAGLCHLGRMLEQAAPCVGALPLQKAAREMQVSINDPHCHTRAISVENCAKVLERTLEALGGKKQPNTTPAETAEIS